MKYCSNCGQQLEDDVMLCPNCGQSTEPEAPADEAPAAEAPAAEVPAAEAPAAEAPAAEAPAADGEGKKFKLSPKVIGIAAGAAVLILVLALLIPMLGGGTQVDFLSIQKDFLSERLAPVTAQLEKMAEAKGFSSDITVSADIAGLDDFLEDTSVLLKVDAQAEKLLMDAEITLMGTPALSGKVEYNKGKLGFILPELDEKYYVMDLSTVLSELTGEEIDLTKADTLELPEKELEALAKEYLEIALGVMTKENVTKVKEDGIRFDKLSSYRMSDEEEEILSDLEDDFKGTVYTFAPKAEDIEAVLEALAEKLENDEKLRELIAETLQQEELTEIVSEDLMEEYVDMDDLIDDIEDMLDDLADEIRDNAEEFAEAVEDAGFVWTLCMEGKQVRMIRLETEEEECAAVYANSTDKSGEVTELFYYCDYGSCEVIEHTYTVDGKKVEGEVNVDSADFSFEYELDTAKTSKLGLPYGTYEVKVDGVKVELEVLESKAGGVDHVISISDPYSDMDAEVTVNLTEKGSAKAPGGKSTDISDYDEDDFAELFEDMGGELIDVLSDIDDLEELMDELYWYF